MSTRWLLVGAVGFGLAAIAAQSAPAADATSSSATLPSATSPSANSPAAASAPKPVAAPAVRSASELRTAVAEALRHANAAKNGNVAPVVRSLVELYRELGRDVLLPAKERVRLGLQVRARLGRFVSQFRYEMAHNNLRGNSNAASNATSNIAASQTAGSAGPAAAEGLDDMVELIRSTIGRPDDWVAVQQRQLQQAANGQVAVGGFGVGGAGAAGAAHGGGAFGNTDEFNKAAEANGADLVDLIQKTVDPPSWDINGGPGTIMYFNNLRVLVVRQTAEAQDDVGGLLGGLRK